MESLDVQPNETKIKYPIKKSLGSIEVADKIINEIDRKNPPYDVQEIGLKIATDLLNNKRKRYDYSHKNIPFYVERDGSMAWSGFVDVNDITKEVEILNNLSPYGYLLYIINEDYHIMNKLKYRDLSTIVARVKKFIDSL